MCGPALRVMEHECSMSKSRTERFIVSRYGHWDDDLGLLILTDRLVEM